MPDRKDPDDVVDLDEGTRIDESLLSSAEPKAPQPVALDGDSEATRFVAPSPSPAEPEGSERTVLIESPFARPGAAEPPPPPPPRARIEIRSGPDAGRTWPLEGPGPFLVGRSLDCPVVLNDPTASRKHFEVRFEGDAWRLRDLGAGNGTVVHGVRVDREIRLESGALIEAGRTQVLFHCDSPSPAIPEAVPPDEEKTRMVESMDAIPLPGSTTPGKIPTGIDRAAIPAREPVPGPSVRVTRATPPADEEGSEAGGFPWLPVAGGAVVAILLAIGIAQFGFGVRIIPLGGPPEPTAEEMRQAEEARRQQAVQETRNGIREALANRQWDRVVLLVQQARQESLAIENLDQTLALARSEKRNRSLIEAAREALEQNSPQEARELLSQVPDSSVQYSEARELISTLDRQGIQQRIEETRGLLRSGRKAEARKAFLALLTEFPEDGQVMDLRKEFVAAGVALDPPATPGGSPEVRAPQAADRPAPAKGAKEKALALYRQEKFQEAVDLLRRGGKGGVPDEDEGLAVQVERFAALLAEGREAVRTKRLDRAESVLQQALRLDQGIGGAFAQEIRSLLGATYRGRAAAAIAEADYVTGSKAARRALAYNASDAVAQDILDKCLVQAQQEYEQAVKDARAGRTDQSRARAQKVLDIVPKGHPLEEKAAALLR